MTMPPSIVPNSVDHPQLKIDSFSIRKLLRKYGQCGAEVRERACQLAESEFLKKEAIRPVNLKFSLDLDYLQSAVEPVAFKI